MNNSVARALSMLAATLYIPASGAQVPGEDPIVLRGAAPGAMQFTPPPPRSGALDGYPGMTAAERARIARYEAKAFGADTTGIQTGKDVINSVTAAGMQRTCVQEVGSTTQGPATPGTKYGPGQSPQVVVLRGDLVNICR